MTKAPEEIAAEPTPEQWAKLAVIFEATQRYDPKALIRGHNPVRAILQSQVKP